MSLGLEMIDFPLQDGEAVFIKIWGDIGSTQEDIFSLLR
jgi:hypothetical protein